MHPEKQLISTSQQNRADKYGQYNGQRTSFWTSLWANKKLSDIFRHMFPQFVDWKPTENFHLVQISDLTQSLPWTASSFYQMAAVRTGQNDAKISRNQPTYPEICSIFRAPGRKSSKEKMDSKWPWPRMVMCSSSPMAWAKGCLARPSIQRLSARS